MDLSQPIARGRTAEILALPDGSVLKLYERGLDKDHAVRERNAFLWASKQDLPVPKVGPLMDAEGRFGFTMEWVDGPNGMAVIMSDISSADDEARKLARLQIEVNACSGDGLPDRKALLKPRIERCDELSPDEKGKLFGVLKRLPEGKSLVHGDFHPGNIIWSAEGPKIIDWIDACSGDPASDVARSLVLFGYPLLGERDADDPRNRYTRVYLDEYRRLTSQPLEGLDDWLLVTAAARLVEGAAKDDQILRDQIHRALNDRVCG